MKKILYILFFISGSFLKSYGQDPQFTQFYSNPLYQSPSFAGAIIGYRASLNYRDQWPKMPGRLTTATFAIDYNLSAFNSGIGLFVMDDKAGTSNYSNLNLGLLYSYNVQINRKIFFRPGAGFYYTQRSMDYYKMIFSSELESGGSKPILPSEFGKVGAADASVSALLLVHNFWVGAVTDHLARPNVSVTDYEFRLPIKYSVFAGYRFYKMERIIGIKRQSVTIVGNYRHQGLADQFDFGLYWSYSPIVLGMWYRDLPLIKQYHRRDAIALLAGFQYKDLNIGYSYDFTVSRLITSTGGAHEVSVIYKFEIEQRKKFKPIPCPEF